MVGVAVGVFVSVGEGGGDEVDGAINEGNGVQGGVAEGSEATAEVGRATITEAGAIDPTRPQAARVIRNKSIRPDKHTSTGCTRFLDRPSLFAGRRFIGG